MQKYIFYNLKLSKIEKSEKIFFESKIFLVDWHANFLKIFDQIFDNKYDTSKNRKKSQEYDAICPVKKF